MIVDASAVLAILMAETDAARFAGAITHSHPRVMSALGWLEIAMAVDRRGDAMARNQFETFFDRARIDIVPVTQDLTILARQAFADWGKGNHRARLNMGDCVSYALARQRGEPLLFKGNDFSLTDIEPALKN
jgi:ribonuclease VapC